ncbi:MAG: NAD-dependent epimerase/dehydratase family protein [Burkholderiaceae bacterium]|jgi:2'-hydroxyisoflavone reductase
MEILVLGGTNFLGRHFVEAALARGNRVTLFHRGKSPNPFGDAVEVRLGDRDPQIGSGLGALESGQWDVVLDTSGYLPRHVRASADLLFGRVGHYYFVSSVSAYADLSAPGVDETAPLAVLSDPASEDVATDYGALKAACEAVVLDRYGKQALIVRPGLIVGPHDPTDRFPYWAARFGAPTLLGERGSVAVMPGPPGRAIQCIDARDIVLWIFLALQAQRGGAYNLTSPPGQWTMGSLAESGHKLSVKRGFDVSIHWVEDAELVAAGVAPWTGLPLWLPASDTTFQGLQSVDVTRALDSGLTIRPLLETITDTLEALITTPAGTRFQNVLPAALEEALAKPSS